MSHQTTVIGRVVGLWRYPVKSMRGESLEATDVSWHGLAGDRRWAFVRGGVEQSSFPWLTLRQRGDMSDYVPSFTNPDQPETSPTKVQTPTGDLLDITDKTLSAELWPDGARVIRQSRGIFDTFPISLVTTQTLEWLTRTLDRPMDVRRFRPNILVEAADDSPFLEDDWVGGVVQIGETRIRIDKRDGRCVVITVDPETGTREPDVLRAVASEREGCLGVYGTTVQPGRIVVGDTVRLEATG